MIVIGKIMYDHLIPYVDKLVWVWVEETHYKKYYTYAFLLELKPEENIAIVYLNGKCQDIYIGNVEIIEEWENDQEG